ncbi:hypothetical protein B9Z55_018338 [Caenorhabditis nigoni]|uniref:Uncharacterized protein n=1 Tax=Caenorhabditis nigoni TaxID=1611254 RepID=A0A2G5TDE8_9PELO|nr:hypothetical protein B9Z55_018338 [Caenorhabditis nigoni]
MDSDSFSSLSEVEKIEILKKLTENLNQKKLALEKDQKKLSELRKTIPDECEELLEKERKILLKHYLTAKLSPPLPELNIDEVQRMCEIITARGDAQVANREKNKHIVQQTEEKNHQNERLQKQVDDLGARLLLNMGF